MMRVFSVFWVLSAFACGYQVEIASLPDTRTESDSGTNNVINAGTDRPNPRPSGNANKTDGGSRDSGTPWAPKPDAGNSPWPRFEEGLPYCQSSLDCSRSQFCRDRGDGVRLCMGESPPSAYCVSSNDCADGFCKDRGDGLRVCMGEGKHGDYCLSSNDCAAGFCKDRGDGVPLCMNNGTRGQFCASSLDCASSLFCKERHDGLKVCM